MERFAAFGVRLLAAYFLLEGVIIVSSPITTILGTAAGLVPDVGVGAASLFGQAALFALPDFLTGGGLLVLAGPIAEGVARSGAPLAAPDEAALARLGTRLGGVFLLALTAERLVGGAFLVIESASYFPSARQALAAHLPRLSIAAVMALVGIGLLAASGRKAPPEG